MNIVNQVLISYKENHDQKTKLGLSQTVLHDKLSIERLKIRQLFRYIYASKSTSLET